MRLDFWESLTVKTERRIGERIVMEKYGDYNNRENEIKEICNSMTSGICSTGNWMGKFICLGPIFSSNYTSVC